MSDGWTCQPSTGGVGRCAIGGSGRLRFTRPSRRDRLATDPHLSRREREYDRAHGTADREREPWEGSRPGAFLTIANARGDVALQALGVDRYLLTGAGHEQQITGFDEARAAAYALASVEG